MEFTQKQYKELCKLYPKIRIPFFDQAEYYLELLIRTMDIFPIILKMRDCINKHGNLETYKMSRFDKILTYFKDNGILEKFSNAPYSDYQSQYPKQFNSWQEGKIYLSFDVNEANWSIFKHTIDLYLPKWSDFLQQQFEIHPFVAESKSFRQLVLGNLNPSRQQTFQKRYMGKVVERIGITAPLLVHNVVMLSADEILFEFNSEEIYQQRIERLDEVIPMLKLPMKRKVFTVKRISSYGDSVVLKTDFMTGKDELFAVNGNRYFIHYRNLILKEEPQDNDLLFEPEPGKLAKWIL